MWNVSIAPASMKYIARRPRIAKMFDVKTMSGSLVSAKIAGTESTAKTMSLSSRKSSATSRGVAHRRPSRRTKKRCPCREGVTGTNRVNSLITGFLSGWISFSGAKNSLTPVRIRNAPNRMTTQWYCISTAPRAMKIARNTRAPRMP